MILLAEPAAASTALPLPALPAVATPADALLAQLQMRVARRADALARRGGFRRASDRDLWLRAEVEIFEGSGLQLTREWIG